jgi:hypothetical protein
MEIRLLNDRTIFLKGKKESILVDPGEKELKENKNNSRIVLFTSGEFDKSDLSNEKIVIRGSGEYEIGGVEINGVNGEDSNTVYRIVIDGFILVIIGRIKQEISAKRVEKIDSTDILVAPVKIGENSSFKLVKSWAKEWGANYLIPLAENEESLKLFLDAADEEGLEKVDSLKLDKTDDLPDGLEIKLLKKTE